MAKPALHSRRFTPGSLNEWRSDHNLYVREMAWLLGIPVSTLKDKLYGRSPIRLDTDRVIGGVEMLMRRGVAPEGWPERLFRRIATFDPGMKSGDLI